MREGIGNVGRKGLGEGMGIEGCGKGKGNGDWEFDGGVWE